VGIQQAFGVGESVDLRLRREGVFVDKEVADLQAGVLGFGPKFGFVKTQKFFFSGYFPFGFALERTSRQGIILNFIQLSCLPISQSNTLK